MDNERHAIDSTEHEKPAEGSKSELSDLLERRVVLRAVNDEPEYPGEPEVLMRIIKVAVGRNDEDMVLEICREVVRQTKRCIARRVQAL